MVGPCGTPLEQARPRAARRRAPEAPPADQRRALRRLPLGTTGRPTPACSRPRWRRRPLRTLAPRRPAAPRQAVVGVEPGERAAAAHWSALGTYVSVLVARASDLPRVREMVEAQLRALDEACSRFRDD